MNGLHAAGAALCENAVPLRSVVSRWGAWPLAIVALVTLSAWTNVSWAGENRAENTLAGYQPLTTVAVRLWDLGKAYGKGLSMGFVGWKDRAQWRPIPYGTVPEKVENDVALEGPAFFFNITWRSDSYISGPVLYRKPDPTDPDEPRHNLLYRGWYANGGIWEGGGNLDYIRVMKNTPEEVVVRSRGRKGGRDPASTGVEADYGVKAGKPWFEITPVNQCTWIGMHGESRFAICPEAEADGSDYVYDALPIRGDKDGRLGYEDHERPLKCRMLFDFVMDDDNLWAMMLTPADPDADKDTNRMSPPIRKQRFLLSVQVDGYNGGWSFVGEGPCKQVVSAPYGVFLGRKIVIGHLRVGYWHYQKIDAEVQKGQDFTIAWKYVYERTVKGSPFKTGEAWWPLYPGAWRLVARIGGAYHTLPITVGKEAVGKRELTFVAPAAGKLEYVLFYFYDRTADTPQSLYTPMDVYNEAVLGKPREAPKAPAQSMAIVAKAPAPPPPAIPAKALDEWKALLRTRVISGVAGGQHPAVFLRLAGSETRAKALSADDKGMKVEYQGGILPVPWAWLSGGDYLNLAKAFAKEGVADDCILLAVFLLAEGQTAVAEECFDKAIAADLQNGKSAVERARASLKEVHDGSEAKK
jgi:hypothetical protein